VLDVHHRVADVQFRQVADDLVRVEYPGRALAALLHLVAEDFALGDHRERRQPETPIDGRDGDAERCVGGNESRKTVDLPRPDPGARQEVGQDFAAACGVGDEQRPAAVLAQESDQQFSRIAGACIRLDARHRAAVEALFVAARAIEHDATVTVQQFPHFIALQVEPCGWQDRALHVVGQALVAVQDLLPVMVGCRDRTLLLDDERCRRQVVEQVREFFEEQRQVVLDAPRWNPLAHVLVETAAPHVDIERVVPAVAKARYGGVVERMFAGRQQAHGRNAIDGALVVRVEGSQALDLVVEQIDPDRQAGPHREDVEQRAPHGVFAMADHRLHRLVAGAFETPTVLVQIELLAGGELERVGVDVTHRDHPLHQRLYRHDQDQCPGIRPACAQRVQGGDALGGDVLVRGEGVVGQRLPVRKLQYRELRGDELEFAQPALRRRGVGGDDQRHRRLREGGLGDRERGGAAVQVAPLGALAWSGRRGWREGAVGLAHLDGLPALAGVVGGAYSTGWNRKSQCSLKYPLLIAAGAFALGYLLGHGGWPSASWLAGERASVEHAAAVPAPAAGGVPLTGADLPADLGCRRGSGGAAHLRATIARRAPGRGGAVAGRPGRTGPGLVCGRRRP
jgi:hypothetical protein